jgi:uncharacterized protein YjbI with pentapeptide repeats
MKNDGMNTTRHVLTRDLRNDFSDKNLQRMDFKYADFGNFNFSNCDLRGMDFSSADLTGAVLSNVKIGIPPTRIAVKEVGIFYLNLTLLLVALMFIVGTIGRVAGSISNALFVTTAVGGSLFATSTTDGIGAAIIAISSDLISKRALINVKNFGTLGKIAFFMTEEFGTSFKKSTLTSAKFMDTVISNADFSQAHTSSVSWDSCKRINCKTNLMSR